MDKLLIDHLPIIAAIEDAAKKSWDEIVADDDRVWIDLYEAEIADMNVSVRDKLKALNDDAYTYKELTELLGIENKWAFLEKAAHETNFTPSELSIIEKLYNELNK